MSSDDSVNLITAIIDNLNEPGWQAFAVVVVIDGRRVSSITGYVYMPDGQAEPATMKVMPIDGALIAYLDATYAADEAWPVQLLVQYDRAAGGYEITTEDTDENRWDVNADDPFALREQVRPNFGE